MVGPVWNCWLNNLDKTMRAQKRKILFFVYNCYAHKFMGQMAHFHVFLTDYCANGLSKCNSLGITPFVQGCLKFGYQAECHN